MGFLAQPDEHVVAEQQAVADLDDVTGDAVVLGADAHTADDVHAAVAELFQALLVEGLGGLPQALPLVLQALVQHS